MKDILFLNHREKQCGVYQYGKRSYDILKKSKKYNFIYAELESIDELIDLIMKYSPHAVIYNHHPSTMPWLTSEVLNRLPQPFHFGIYHENAETMQIWFDYYIISDSTFVDKDNKYSIPRPLFEKKVQGFTDLGKTPIIGSFGFGFYNKGFQRLIDLVQEEYNEATIKLNIPFSYYGDRDGRQAKEIARFCYSKINKPGIQLYTSHDFLTNDEILEFLSANCINAFLYDEMPGRGLSSVIDYALSVNRPIAITKTNMFRHISDATPSICIEESSLHDLVNNHEDPLKPYREKWSHENFIKKYEYIIDKTVKQ